MTEKVVTEEERGKLKKLKSGGWSKENRTEANLAGGNGVNGQTGAKKAKDRKFGIRKLKFICTRENG